MSRSVPHASPAAGQVPAAVACSVLLTLADRTLPPEERAAFERVLMSADTYSSIVAALARSRATGDRRAYDDAVQKLVDRLLRLIDRRSVLQKMADAKRGES